MACSKSCKTASRGVVKTANKVLRGNYSSTAKKAAVGSVSQRRSYCTQSNLPPPRKNG